jgi:hypothetical protein
MADNKKEAQIFEFDTVSVGAQVFDLFNVAVDSKGQLAAELLHKNTGFKFTLKSNGDATIHGNASGVTLQYKIPSELKPGIKKAFQMGATFVEFEAKLDPNDGRTEVNLAVGYGIPGFSTKFSGRAYINIKGLLDRAVKYAPGYGAVTNWYGAAARREKEAGL